MDGLQDLFTIALFLYIAIPVASALLLAIIYTIFTVLIRKSIELYSYEFPLEEELPEISVIIAAKNEEQHIEKSIHSVLQQNYPDEKFELIVVDDESTDKTAEIINKMAEKNKNLRLIDGTAKKLPAKKGALQLGVAETMYNCIVITDADCTHENDWLRGMAAAFNNGADITFGVAPLMKRDSLVSKLAAYENFRGQLLSAFFSKWGKPHSAAARSFGYTKEAFIVVAGYSNTLDTISGDDDLFIREGLRQNLKVKPFYNSGTFVFSETKKTWQEYFNQRKRHTAASTHYLPLHIVLLAFWHLINIAALFSFALCLLSCYFVLLLGVKLLFDVLIGRMFEKQFGCRFSLPEKMYLPFLYEWGLIIHFFRSLFSKQEW